MVCAQQALSAGSKGVGTTPPNIDPAQSAGSDAPGYQPQWSLALASMWIPTVDISDEWAARFARFSDFMQDTLTTSMVTLWTTSPLWTLVLYIYLIVYVKVLRTFLLLYLVYCFCDPRPYDGVGRRVASIQKLPLWKHVNAYFQPKMVFEAPLNAKAKYVFGSHPHGVISYVSQLVAGTTGLGIEAQVPGLVVRGVTMPATFAIPFFRDWALAMGCLSCDRSSIRRILSDRHHRLHQSLLVVVGGAEESMLAHEGSADLILLKRRGFVREAIRAGCDLVPIYNFNENSIYKLVNNQQGSLVHRFEMAIKSLFGFTILLFYGRNVFFTPFRTQLVSVVGRPIPVQRNYNPTEEEIKEYHDLYVEELKRVYIKYKPRYAPDAADIRFVA
ncbi:diacylglycerol O-acyltransferase 1 [Coemansia sp. RSA 1935]|nr:diacylglycerol O-acyltransferase 1 [Coemansia sp. RSA 1591]KAJ1755174.1 diacylglycerol O-acyltransferase 1 [Coemansia sp. RSA 1752]KAJ1763743.1 diacylglycerol O-acyltransferase 1 [Coemansia sp. RSA 1824]KAJ1782420.1 diacylglycerol O-acyltransferase 1 [Coemansia sp. RSA 1938]KAJ2153696.1 diacylglycerol O-acyltransferase 1 [Coemansia sp. RSA 637]KAJ2445167.1 diacylglycerol O-acyltransferase 1 [Coemansia sp. RSA 2440]KAJ2535090.1 diacylglycerol O-acyltransferase 1 [Coemansia sp. RSA 1935]